MAVEVVLGTPLAESLQDAIQTKITEAGWTGLDDSGLAEYILLMLVNGRDPEQVASELSTDMLDVAPDDPKTLSFARWLFDEAARLSGQKPDGGHEEMSSATAGTPRSDIAATTDQSNTNGTGSMEHDAVMGDSGDVQGSSIIPKGPKSMQNGTPSAPTGPKNSRKPMIGQINKNLTRTPEPSLHRIKGLASSGRINTHNRDLPRGPTPKGPRGNPRNQPPSTRMQNAIQSQVNGMTQQQGHVPALSPDQQMQMLAMYEGMMAQMLSPQQQQAMSQGGMFGMANQMNQMGQQPGSGKSLFDRVDTRGQRHSGNFKSRQPRQASRDNGADGMDLTSSMEVENSSQPGPKPDPTTTLCRFNLFCTKADCGFVHQSPAAPPDTSIDMSDTCTYGAACMNKKCAGKHPSPAQKLAHQTTAVCRFFPNCTNPHCPFQHPTPMCRNGADCNKTGCAFAHSTIVCKFNPCLNPMCTFKHAEGQKRGNFQDKVWINPEAEEGDGNQEHHKSERKFVDENLEEELILPEKGGVKDGEIGVKSEDTGIEEMKIEEIVT